MKKAQKDSYYHLLTSAVLIGRYAPQESNYIRISREKPTSSRDDALSDRSPILSALAALVSKLTEVQRASLTAMLTAESDAK